MINRRKELDDVALQDVAIFTRELLGAVERGVRPFAAAIGVGIENKCAFKDRLDDVAERVMHDAVAKWRGADESSLAVVQAKVGVRARDVGLG